MRSCCSGIRKWVNNTHWYICKPQVMQRIWVCNKVARADMNSSHFKLLQREDEDIKAGTKHPVLCTPTRELPSIIWDSCVNCQCNYNTDCISTTSMRALFLAKLLGAKLAALTMRDCSLQTSRKVCVLKICEGRFIDICHSRKKYDKIIRIKITNSEANRTLRYNAALTRAFE